MSKKMLIDAVHPEETRVVVMDDKRMEDFDFESKVKTSYKSNIYLAKVTRVEPSLQAAFVNYGGNRHGFLPFSEIHPDYYRIPVEDRQRLMAEQEEIIRKITEAAEAKSKDGTGEDLGEDDIDALIEEVSAEINGGKKKDKPADDTVSEETAENETPVEEPKANAKKPAKGKKKTAPAEVVDESDSIEEADDNVEDHEDDDDAQTSENAEEGVEGSEGEEEGKNSENKNDKGRFNKNRFRGRRGRRGSSGKRYAAAGHSSSAVDTVGGDDFDADPTALLWKKMRRTYKIQEVIKRGQVMLVQVQKEERGNKGAAVTSYITLPGRYGVLMPNSPRGGGISRKINWGDRKKLKDILKDVNIPKGMSVILRTAAVERNKTEIKRDLDYLYKLWDSIRELTLNSNAPALVYEEGALVKRAIRDLYTRDVEDVIIAGEQAYKDAKEFMKMMIPSHVKRVQLYTDTDIPLFTRYHAESQLDEIYDTQVNLKSGGYLVIHPTEALVSIDVNSGRSTKERNIEGTALRTNLETADEVARQLRLRDLGGLIVIDFIDMEDYRNNREVERRLTEALSTDRARVQVGRISNFGLMELSRQRLRPSLMETHFETCHYCQGAGTIRTKPTAALRVIRAIEDEAMKGRTEELHVEVPTEIGMYILNEKRDILSAIEGRNKIKIFIRFNDTLHVSEFTLDRQRSKALIHEGVPAQDNKQDSLHEVQLDTHNDDSDDEDEEKPQPQRNTNAPDRKPHEGSSEDRPHKKRRRRSRNRRPDGERTHTPENGNAPSEAKPAETVEKPAVPVVEAKEEAPVAEKKPAAAKAKKAPAKAKKAPSNDDAPKAEAPADSKEPAKKKAIKNNEFEVVNQPPQNKKKGWWNNILES
jgi:ribonuclease E